MHHGPVVRGRTAAAGHARTDCLQCGRSSLVIDDRAHDADMQSMTTGVLMLLMLTLMLTLTMITDVCGFQGSLIESSTALKSRLARTFCLIFAAERSEKMLKHAPGFVVACFLRENALSDAHTMHHVAAEAWRHDMRMHAHSRMPCTGKPHF